MTLPVFQPFFLKMLEKCRFCFLWAIIPCFILVFSGSSNQVQAQSYEPVEVNLKNRITSNWLVYDTKSNSLVPFLTRTNSNYQAFYQWIDLNPDKPFQINFTAKKELSLFIDNKLAFVADSTASYSINLTDYIKGEDVAGKHLLTIWHPNEQPNVLSFVNFFPDIRENPDDADFVKRIVREEYTQNAFIIFLLFIGLIYGALKTSYTADFTSIFKISTFMRSSALEEGFLSRPISSWSSILFVIAFSLSFALLIVAIHTNVQNIFIFNRLFKVSEADITSKVLFYTFVVFAFIILKLLFLQLMAYIFDLSPLVSIQYREFIRTILFLGIFLPVVMVVYLAINSVMPAAVVLISNIAVSGMLIIATIRIFYTINNRVSLLNLHLFSYLCATEIIPLAILLKLILFNY